MLPSAPPLLRSPAPLLPCSPAPLLLCLLLLAACRAEPLPPPTTVPAAPPTLQIGVSSSATTMAALLTAATTDWPVQAHFVPANDAALLTDLQSGALDAALLHHLPAALPNWFNPVALDGLVVVVHSENPVDGLTSAEVQAIFNGRITNWRDVGGADLPVVLVSRERGAGALALFRSRVMVEQRISVNAQVQAGDEALMSTVAGTPGAIGFSMMGNAAGATLKMIAIDGRFPTPAETGAQSYPLTAPLYFVMPGAEEPAGALRDLLAWLQSDAGQGVINGRYGTVR